MTDGTNTRAFKVVEICAGAGGQALGLEKAGFEHELAVELDDYACQTLHLNRDWDVRLGDVADRQVWDPADFRGIDLFAGGVPCPPFSIAGRQLGASDERDLFSWAVEQVATVQPRALMLENVRGLSTPRFAAYRQRVLDRLAEYGYVPFWKLLNASDFGVPQLRPRFVLVALQEQDAMHFAWPEPAEHQVTVGSALRDLMGERSWKYVDTWAEMANGIGPTIVGGSKKHGGADLGPTRAKQAWRSLGVDGMGIANEPPERLARHPRNVPPKLTIEMVARLQGWKTGEWKFAGRKTAQYRQIGNAFPPPVAAAVGSAIVDSFNHVKPASVNLADAKELARDDIYQVLQESRDYVSQKLLLEAAPTLDIEMLERRLALLGHDFEILTKESKSGVSYKLGAFRGFVGQEDHRRHEYIAGSRSKVS